MAYISEKISESFIALEEQFGAHKLPSVGCCDSGSIGRLGHGLSMASATSIA